METLVVTVGRAREVFGRDGGEVVLLTVRVVWAFGAEEEGEAELHSPGVVDALHARHDGLFNLTLFLFFDKVAEGDPGGGGEDVLAGSRGGGTLVVLAFFPGWLV